MGKEYIDGTSCKAISGQFGEFFNMSFNLEKLQQYANDKGYINMTMSKRREPGQYGDTHYFTLNDWKPEGETNNSDSNAANANPVNKPKVSSVSKSEDISVEDLPF